MPYLTTIHRRWRFCFIENKGARICFDGRNQTRAQIVSLVSAKGERRHTEKCCVDTVKVGDQDWRREHEQQQMTKDQIRAP